MKFQQKRFLNPEVYLISAQVHARPPGPVLQTSVGQLQGSHLSLHVLLQTTDIFLQLSNFILSLIDRQEEGKRPKQVESNLISSHCNLLLTKKHELKEEKMLENVYSF